MHSASPEVDSSASSFRLHGRIGFSLTFRHLLFSVQFRTGLSKCQYRWGLPIRRKATTKLRWRTRGSTNLPFLERIVDEEQNRARCRIIAVQGGENGEGKENNWKRKLVFFDSSMITSSRHENSRQIYQRIFYYRSISTRPLLPTFVVIARVVSIIEEEHDL